MSGLSSRGGLPSSASCPALADVDSYPASKVLPFLYLGNSKDAADLSCLQGLGTTCVLNVTSQLPGYHEECGITYKQIPASDSGHQNLKQYFEEAFEFIGEYKYIIRYDWPCQRSLVALCTRVCSHFHYHETDLVVCSFIKYRPLNIIT